jgi:hypothetical protein
MKTPTKKQQATWAKGAALYDEFLEYFSYIHDVNARKIARTPCTNTLESFAEAANDRPKLNRLMMAEYRSNQPTK